VVWLIDFLVVTEREKLVATVNSIGRALHDVDTDRVFQHVSDRFEYGGMKKAAFHEAVRRGVRVYQVHEMKLWDINVQDVDKEKRTAKIEFYAKVRGNWSASEAFWLVDADFVLDPDGQWRLLHFTLHNPGANTREPVSIPLPR